MHNVNIHNVNTHNVNIRNVSIHNVNIHNVNMPNVNIHRRYIESLSLGTLKNRCSVCAGYANLFKALCEAAGLKAVYVSSTEHRLYFYVFPIQEVGTRYILVTRV